MKRHVFVTGGCSGIGEAVTKKFLELGECVTVSDIDSQKVNTLQEKMKTDANYKVNIVTGDVSKREQVMAMFAEAVQNAGPVDVLVNCAGIYPSNPIVNVTDEEWNRVMDVNLRGTFLCSQIAVQNMVEHKSGCIINITSIDGRVPGPNNVVYSASKAGVISLTRSFAAEYTSLGIRINAVAPGWVGTANIYSNDRWKEAIKKIPLGRLAEPSEIADLVYFLCSEQGKYIVGEVININGGMFMN